MRPFPAPRDFGAWDKLPEFPTEDELDLSNPDVKDALERRDLLVEEWQQYLTYPHGVWREDCIADFPHFAEQWRNWLLRRAWEGIAFINANARRWSAGGL